MSFKHILESCTPEEKLSYLQLIIFIAFSDHHLADDEAEFLDKITAVAQLSEEEKEQIARTCRHPEHINLQNCAKTVSRSPLREVLLVDLMVVARSDNEVAIEERSAITQIAVLLGVPLDEVIRLTSAVNKYDPEKEDKDSPLQKSMLSKLSTDKTSLTIKRESVFSRLHKFLGSLKG